MSGRLCYLISPGWRAHCRFHGSSLPRNLKTFTLNELHVSGRASTSVLTSAPLESCQFMNGNAGKRTSLEGVSVVEVRPSVEYRSGGGVAVVRVRIWNR